MYIIKPTDQHLNLDRSQVEVTISDFKLPKEVTCQLRFGTNGLPDAPYMTLQLAFSGKADRESSREYPVVFEAYPPLWPFEEVAMSGAALLKYAHRDSPPMDLSILANRAFTPHAKVKLVQNGPKLDVRLQIGDWEKSRQLEALDFIRRIQFLSK